MEKVSERIQCLVANDGSELCVALEVLLREGVFEQGDGISVAKVLVERHLSQNFSSFIMIYHLRLLFHVFLE